MAEREFSLLPYVPKLARRLLRQTPTPNALSRVETLDAVVLLADVSGFTGLVDQLARDHGDRGAERLQETLNRCFGPLTDLVESAGGEVLGFPGDAALAVWTGDRSTSLASLVRRVASCGLDLLARFDRFRADEGAELRLRVAIGAGPSRATLLGGIDGRWETVLLGDAIGQLDRTLASAGPGEMVLSPAAAAFAGTTIRGARRGEHVVVSSVTPVADVAASAPDEAGPIPDDVVKALLPPSLMARIEAGQGAWLAEFRRLTVGFISVRGVDPEDLETLQRTGRLVQLLTTRYEGELHRIVSDEKGVSVIVVFGVAQRAHEDDAARAVRTAIAVRQESAAAGVDVRVGLATGRVFTGRIGSSSRFEFAILGGSVVLAARLAEIAEDILCDAVTHSACRRSILFESRPAIAIKGKTDHVDLWRPLSIRAQSERTAFTTIGRDAERALLERALSALERRAQGGVIVLEGEPGIGKTALVNDVMKLAQSHAVRSLIGGSDAVDRQRAYLSWRAIIGGLLASGAAHDVHSLRERLFELLGTDAVQWSPLLNPVLPVALPEDVHTLGMDGDSRARTTRELIVTMMASAAQSSPLFIVLEDAHWMDSASWELAEQVIARVPRVLLLISARRQMERHPSLERLKARSDATTVVLRPLLPGEIHDLVCRRLDVDDIPAPMADLIDKRAEGHPLFAGELALALRDRGSLVVADGSCRLAASADTLIASRLPETVHATVAARIDQLAPQQQFTLKVAAVLGRRFPFSQLAHVHPLADVPALERDLARIADSGLLQSETGEEGRYSFSHALVQEVAYEQLPFQQRRELHKRTAEWLELASLRSGENLEPLLAHHWERAEVVDRAMHHLEAASERALLRDSSDREAEDFLTRLMALSTSQSGPDPSPLVNVPMLGPLSERSIRLARWERFLSQAVARQGRYLEAQRHMERCIEHLGQRVPSTTLGVRLEFVGGLVSRLVRRPPPVGQSCSPAIARTALLELSLAYERLNEYQYLGVVTVSAEKQRRTGLIARGAATLRGVRAAELAGPSAELSRSYSVLANLVAMCRRPRLAEDYAALGQSIAIDSGSKHALFRALRIGQLFAFNLGRWDTAAAAFGQAIALGGEIGIVVERLMCEHALAYVHLNEGRLEEALAEFSVVRTHALRHDALIPALWSTVSIGEVAFRQGRPNEAIEWAEEALARAEARGTSDQNCRFQAHGLLTSARLRTDGVERMRPHIDQAIAAAAAGAQLSLTPQCGFFGVAEGLYALWDRGGDDRIEADRRLRPWLRTLRRVAFYRPILDPLDLVCRAWWSARHRNARVASRHLRKAIRLADQMKMAYESALARVELGRVLQKHDAERRSTLDEACRISARIGAAALVHEAETLIAGDQPSPARSF